MLLWTLGCNVQTKLGSVCPCTTKPIYWDQIVGKESTLLIACTKQRVWAANAQKTGTHQWLSGKDFFKRWGRRLQVHNQLTDVLLIGWSRHLQPSGSNQSRVCVLVGSVQLTSSALWGFQYLQNSSKDVGQNIIDSLWGGTKDPWLCLMAKLLLSCLVWMFPLFLHFLTCLIAFVFWNLRRA